MYEDTEGWRSRRYSRVSTEQVTVGQWEMRQTHPCPRAYGEQCQVPAAERKITSAGSQLAFLLCSFLYLLRYMPQSQWNFWCPRKVIIPRRDAKNKIIARLPAQERDQARHLPREGPGPCCASRGPGWVAGNLSNVAYLSTVKVMHTGSVPAHCSRSLMWHQSPPEGPSATSPSWVSTCP